MKSLALSTCPSDPYPLFADWYDEASACEQIMYAGAMCLSTIGPEGVPDGRIVLMHRCDESGVAFFTDVRSPKGRSLIQFPEAALTFYWGPLERQVRLQGRVTLSSNEESDLFFRERPRRSKVTAWASEQSQPLKGRARLERRMAAVESRFEGQDEVPRPAYWKAYRLRPRKVEFWVARARRLHDRILYTRTGDGRWITERLSP